MIQMNDLVKQYDGIRDDVERRIAKVVRHGKFIMGPEIEELENKLQDYVGVKHAVTCSSGTDALLMALLAWGIGPGDAVFTTPFTFVATAEVIANLGATPVFVDIDQNSFNMNPSELEKSVKKVLEIGELKASVIIPVDLFGLPADYEEIWKTADKYDLKILEDGAQSFGSSLKGKKTGSLAHVGATSFFPAKPLGCYGDGGAVFTDDDEMYEILKSIRVHGKGEDKYHNVRIGLNSRLDTMQAAVLLAKLEVFDHELFLKNRIASLYHNKLQGMVQTPHVNKTDESSWAQYSVLSQNEKERDLFKSKLTEAGISSAIYYKTPLHLQPVFKTLGYEEGDFPVAEDISKRILSLPMHPYLTEDEINAVVNVFSKTIEAM
ncbi:DegT/DnrJ/EryC1/StrS family aminotransferase [Sinanaerobacter sp. ZZT-01]|uniref:DegT/DnrJ/EryC1/StrS family aminotransferase n=1 Tax=Sinanaerobacter sp. ZZT-01 TaxID=3111540 RepID=UPI002D766BA2|nr:DegT/DnrJ/EryC1/StrS family aminotransferase [Sinanaerobacter sp. ZZT-01]WRR93009.1 DegT/DnrJ/EryC1/StrS family aminotransferase [Sinanaerobacter sp. ZZT-01]